MAILYFTCVTLALFIGYYTNSAMQGILQLTTDEQSKKCSHMGRQLVVWCLSRPLSCDKYISWRDTFGICFRWGSFDLHVSSCLAHCNNMYTQIWYTNHYGSGHFLRDRSAVGCLMVHRDLAAVSQPRDMFRLGNGIPVHRLCRALSSMVSKTQILRQ